MSNKSCFDAHIYDNITFNRFVTFFYMHPMKKSTLITIVIVFTFFTQLFSQACDCGEETQINICYLSNQAVCSEPGVSDCRYLMDGEFLTGVRNKLQNSNNFGPNGVVNCQVQLSPLDAVPSPEFLDESGCDVVFVGSSVEYSQSVDILESDILKEYLQNIREWSIQCEENLVIVTQAEAFEWGYETYDRNVNPNFAFANESSLSVFDGPFGSLISFEQGGSFQGIFEVLPASGAIILGVDDNGKPTLALDELTNDIVAADIGIFCSNGAGPISGNATISSINPNDILVANIFALGCQIAQNNFNEFQFAALCPGEDYTLPGGAIVNTAGLYVDSLLTVMDCDSVIETEIWEVEEYMDDITYNGCSGDGYEVVINEVAYNENRQSGVEFMETSFGCDSVVTINLSYEKLDTSYFDTIICVSETVDINGTIISPDATEEFVISRTDQCDSIHYVNVSSYPDYEIDIETYLTIKLGTPYIFNNQIPENVSIQWLPEEGLDCYDCPNPALLEFDIDQYQVLLEDENGCSKSFTITLDYYCSPYIPNIINLSEQDPRNNSLQIFSACPLINFEINVFDRWGNSVYESEDQTEKWDDIRAQDLNQGVYVYVLKYENETEKFSESGTVTITY